MPPDQGVARRRPNRFGRGSRGKTNGETGFETEVCKDRKANRQTVREASTQTGGENRCAGTDKATCEGGSTATEAGRRASLEGAPGQACAATRRQAGGSTCTCRDSRKT